jgi:hypothetical protein
MLKRLGSRQSNLTGLKDAEEGPSVLLIESEQSCDSMYVEAVKPSSLRHLLWRFMPSVSSRDCARVDKRTVPEEHIDQRNEMWWLKYSPFISPTQRGHSRLRRLISRRVGPTSLCGRASKHTTAHPVHEGLCYDWFVLRGSACDDYMSSGL